MIYTNSLTLILEINYNKNVKLALIDCENKFNNLIKNYKNILESKEIALIGLNVDIEKNFTFNFTIKK